MTLTRACGAVGQPFPGHSHVPHRQKQKLGTQEGKGFGTRFRNAILHPISKTRLQHPLPRDPELACPALRGGAQGLREEERVGVRSLLHLNP